MERIATRIASGFAAAGVAVILSTAPAQARVTDPSGLVQAPGCGSTSCVDRTSGAGPTGSATTTKPSTTEATSWWKIALGAAGGVALAGAGAVTVTSRQRHHQAPTSRTPVAG